MPHAVVLLLGSILVMSCGSSQVAPTVRTPSERRSSSNLVLVTIESAVIAPRAAVTEPWDVPDSPDEGTRSAKALAGIMGIVGIPGGPLLAALSELVPHGSPDDDVSYPDPFIQVTFNEPTLQRVAVSPVAVNTIRPSWAYSFYARIDSLRESGLDIAVLDNDGDNSARIGGVNVPREALAAVAATGAAETLTENDGELEKLAVRIEPVILGVSSLTRSYTLDLSTGVFTTDVRVAQGSLITVRSTGEGVVGTWSCTGPLRPSGFPEGKCKDYNLKGWPAFERAPHGSAVALVGTSPTLKAVSLARTDEPAQCVRFIAPASGPLAFAINDRDFSNNEGNYTFELEVEPAPETMDGGAANDEVMACDGLAP